MNNPFDEKGYIVSEKAKRSIVAYIRELPASGGESAVWTKV
jgi:hypothetical protein